MNLSKCLCLRDYTVPDGNLKGFKMSAGSIYLVAKKGDIAFVFSDFRIEAPADIFGPDVAFEPAREGI